MDTNYAVTTGSISGLGTGVVTSTGTGTIPNELLPKGTSITSIPMTSDTNTITWSQQENKNMERCGVSINCTIPDYAYPGLNLALSCIGLSAIILAVAFAYKIYKMIK